MPSDECRIREVERSLRRLWPKLSSIERAVIVLRYEDRLSLDEMAAALRISRSRVEEIQADVLRRIKEAMQAQRHEGTEARSNQ